MKISHNKIKEALAKINKKIADSDFFPKKSRNWELDIVGESVHLVVHCKINGEKIDFSDPVSAE